VRARKLGLLLAQHWSDETTGEFAGTACVEHLSVQLGANKDRLRLLIFHHGETLNWATQSGLLSDVERVVSLLVQNCCHCVAGV
jgi:hypothetical protein